MWSLLLFSASLLRASRAISENIACDSDVQTNVCLHRNYSSMDIPLIHE